MPLGHFRISILIARVSTDNFPVRCMTAIPESIEKGCFLLIPPRRAVARILSDIKLRQSCSFIENCVLLLLRQLGGTNGSRMTASPGG